VVRLTVTVPTRWAAATLMPMADAAEPKLIITVSLARTIQSVEPIHNWCDDKGNPDGIMIHPIGPLEVEYLAYVSAGCYEGMER